MSGSDHECSDDCLANARQVGGLVLLACMRDDVHGAFALLNANGDSLSQILSWLLGFVTEELMAGAAAVGEDPVEWLSARLGGSIGDAL